MAKKAAELIEIKPLEMKYVKLKIKGDTSLITHKWSEKAKKEMLDAQMGKTKGKKKEPKNPVGDFIDSMYWTKGKPSEKTEEAFEEAVKNGAEFGFPITSIKAAAISAAYRMRWSTDKVSLQGSFFLVGEETDELFKIKSDTPVMREDMVRIGKGTADLRYRGQFNAWETEIVMRYNTNGQYSLENIINMINAGGMICGIGEWRVEKGGQFGMFHVEQA